MLFASLRHSVAASSVVDSQRYRYATQPAKNSNIDFESPGSLHMYLLLLLHSPSSLYAQLLTSQVELHSSVGM